MKKTKAFRVFALATSVPWMITEPALRGILSIAARENPPVAVVEEELERELDNKHNFRVEDGVAIIPVIGPVFRYADMFTEISGATSVSTLTKDLDAALADDEVKSILLEIDSPGGEANGINEFAEKVFAARDIKPIESYISGSGCSAAYWIASASRKITTDATASVGSIGVAAVIQDTDEADAAEGIKNIKFVSSKSPNKRPDLSTEEGRNVIQENIDAMADVFIEKVARNRAVTADDVVNRFGRGGVSVGQQAVNCGLADQLGSFSSTLQSLKSGSGVSSNAFAAPLANTKQENINMSLKDKVNPEFESAEVLTSDSITGDAETATEPVKIETAKIEAIPGKIGTIQPQLIDGKTPQEILAELTELRGKVAAADKLKAEAVEESLKLKAETVASTLLSTSKMLPAQKEGFVSSYVTASKDDERNPIEGFSRLDNFVAMFEDKAPNVMTEETVDPEATKVLLGVKQSSASVDNEAIIAQANAYAKKVKTI